MTRPAVDERANIVALTSLAKLLGSLDSLSNAYIESACAHYESEIASRLSTLTATQYIKWVLDTAAEESERAKACFTIEVANTVVAAVRNFARVHSLIVRTGELAVSSLANVSRR